MMADSWQLLFFSLFSLLNLLVICEAQDNNKPWYENLPAVAMDYKVHIDAGKEDCYFQYCPAGATFYVSFQVSTTLLVLNRSLNHSYANRC
jgi:p24 family protein gamma-5